MGRSSGAWRTAFWLKYYLGPRWIAEWTSKASLGHSCVTSLSLSHLRPWSLLPEVSIRSWMTHEISVFFSALKWVTTLSWNPVNAKAKMWIFNWIVFFQSDLVTYARLVPPDLNLRHCRTHGRMLITKPMTKFAVLASLTTACEFYRKSGTSIRGRERGKG